MSTTKGIRNHDYRAAARTEHHIDAVRGFNRFYTRQIGVLREGLLKSPFSLTEVRVLYEIANRQQPTATELCQELGLDPGYLSRILSKLEKRGLVRRSASHSDGRQSLLGLTSKGNKTFATLDARQRAEIAAMLHPIPPTAQSRLVQAMHASRPCSALVPKPRLHTFCAPIGPATWGGWSIATASSTHGSTDTTSASKPWWRRSPPNSFGASIPGASACRIAEKDGEIVGSVFLVKKSKTVAKLRLLLVEPSARGLGIGKRLVDECVRFARQAGYRKMILWTQSELHAARHLYEEAGFRLMQEKPHPSWGRDDLVSEIWELKL